jgi:hypothetical protein
MNGFRWDNIYFAFSIALLIIAFNITVDHLFAPIGLLLSPIINIVSVCLISFNRERFDPILQCVLTFSLIVINDIGIKVFGGGIHDSEGQGVVNLLLLAGSGLCLLILIVSLFKNSSISQTKSILAAFLFVVLIGLYIHFFSELGLSPTYS